MVAIDAWSQLPNARFFAEPWLASLDRWTRQTGPRTPITIDAAISALDAADVDLSLVCAWCGPKGWLITNEEVRTTVEARPDRFAGVASVDLHDLMPSLRELRRHVREHQFKAVRVVPWLWNLPPDDRRYYPVYAECCELGIPFLTQIGHTGPLLSSETGRPIPYLEHVLLDFPELVVVGGHVGFPWMNEVLSLAFKFPNFYIDTSAYAAKRYPRELVDFMRSAGARRVLFGSNFPMLTPAQALDGIDTLGLDDATRRLFLHDNAARVFRLSR